VDGFVAALHNILAKPVAAGWRMAATWIEARPFGIKNSKTVRLLREEAANAPP
jgi:hypothetical protein